MHWNAWKEDLAQSLKLAASPKNLVVRPMTLEVQVSLDEKIHKELAADPKFVQSLRKRCELEADKMIAAMSTVLKTADKQAPGFPDDMVSLFLRPVHMQMEQSFKNGCKRIEAEAHKVFIESQKTHESLKKAIVKVYLDGDFDGIELTKKRRPAGAGVKLVPMSSSKSIHEAVQDLEGLVKRVDEQLRVKGSEAIQAALIKYAKDKAFRDKQTTLQAALGREQANAKLEQATKEAQAGITEDIEKYDPDFKKLLAEWKEISAVFKHAETEHDNWKKKLESSKASIPPDKYKSFETNLKSAELSIDIILTTTARVISSFKTAEKGGEMLKLAATECFEGKTTWAQHTQLVTGWNHNLVALLKDLQKIAIQRSNVVKQAEEKIKKAQAAH